LPELVMCPRQHAAEQGVGCTHQRQNQSLVNERRAWLCIYGCSILRVNRQIRSRSTSASTHVSLQPH
jgi:hypothetical protein